MLTIDVPLQQAAEKSLEENIMEIRKEQIKTFEINEDGYYDDLELDDIDLADSGAAVVIEVETGDVLALASYPTYDPNLFIQGISEEKYEELGFKDAEIAPLLNRAVTSRGTPGSIFKMVTGLAALMEGKTTLDERIDDLGEYTAILKPNGKGPRCWIDNPARHSNQTIVEGLMNSCDYYFYTMADRLGIDLLGKWGEKYGLTSSTGVELPGEAIGQIGNQQVLYDNTKAVNKQNTFIPSLVKNGEKGIVNLLKKFAKEREVEYNDQVYSDTADALIYLAGMEWTPDPDDNDILKDEKGVAMGDYIRSILDENMQIRTNVSKAKGWDMQISTTIAQLRWTPYMTITSGIGQGVVQVTPLAVARYVAAIVNGGTVYETHIVDKVIDQNGEVVYDQQPVVYDTLDAPQIYLDRIMEGMGDVVNAEQGTAKKYFENFKYKDDIGGKTGTAEVTTIDLENNSWFVCFAPYDPDDSSVKPEIAVVVYVPQGLTGGLSSYIAQDIIEFYIDRSKLVAEQTIPVADSLVD